ncbi:MAG: hypothetical protein ABW139_20650, partial [Candidatus Thiodiazotropha sp. DIVDIV]
FCKTGTSLTPLSRQGREAFVKPGLRLLPSPLAGEGLGERGCSSTISTSILSSTRIDERVSFTLQFHQTLDAHPLPSSERGFYTRFWRKN